jgi:formylglycine-generating enzyme required for sulfatase activity
MKRDPAKRDPTPSRPPPAADLALARRLREQTQANRDAAVVAEGLRRRRQRRLVRYLVVIVFALAIGGTLLERRWRAQTPVAPPPAPLAWDPVPALGEPATAPTGCREVTDRGLAPLEGLAEGSLVARDTQLRVAAELRRPLEVENTIGMRFRLIPPGSFVMGSPLTEAGRGPDEPPVVRLIEQPFYLGVTEVTQAQWERIMGSDANPSYFRTAAAQRPVEEITWHEANLFATKLAELEQVPAWTYRLPTEAEWEYACRAGTTTRYCFGDDERRLPEFAVYTVNRETGTEPVARRRANAWGL